MSSSSRGQPLLGIVLACAMSGCESGSLPAADTFRIDRRGATAPATPGRAAIAQIGDELRPVPFGREPTIVATVEGIASHAGPIRTRATLASVDLASGRLALYWGLPGSDQFTRFSRPWRLGVHPRDPTRGKIVFRSPAGDVETPLDVRLERMPPPPVRLESEPFDVPAGATIDLGYGLAPMKTTSGAATTFTATLHCAWAWPRVLVDARVGADGQWHDASMRDARGGRDCRLTLESHPGDGAGEALWSVPRLALPGDPKNDMNVVLISLDTLRADHLSGYGYARRTSPAIDEALMKRGTAFIDASTTFPMTNVAHLGIFTSRYPGALPASGTLGAAVPIRMLTEILRDAGFSTLGITEDGLVSHAYGFAWGFDRLVEHLHAPIEGAQRVFEGGRRLLEEHRDRRFFLFLHTYKVHDPYKPAAGFQAVFPPSPHDEAIHRNVPENHRATFDDYDRCIREADTYVGEFLETLDSLGLADRTLVVLTSDHGEAFGEHVFYGHGFSFYQEALHVPLVFRGPGISAGRRVTTPVSLVDVMPTILDLLGLPSPDETQGRSLRDALAGRGIPVRPLFFEWFGGGGVGVRIGETKVVQVRSIPRTYRLLVDRDEQAPSPGAAPIITNEIRRYVDDGARRRRAFVAARPQTISPELHEALRGLGYVK